jgi:hypothetical protein
VSLPITGEDDLAPSIRVRAWPTGLCSGCMQHPYIRALSVYTGDPPQKTCPHPRSPGISHPTSVRFESARPKRHAHPLFELLHSVRLCTVMTPCVVCVEQKLAELLDLVGGYFDQVASGEAPGR